MKRRIKISWQKQYIFHDTFEFCSVEQHGGIYILQSGNVSTFFLLPPTLNRYKRVWSSLTAHADRDFSWKQTESIRSRTRLYGAAASPRPNQRSINISAELDPEDDSEAHKEASYLLRFV